MLVLNLFINLLFGGCSAFRYSMLSNASTSADAAYSQTYGASDADGYTATAGEEQHDHGHDA